MIGIQMDTNYADTCREWLKSGLRKPSKRAVDLASKLGVARSAVYKMMAGTQAIKTEQLPIIATYIGEPIPGTIRVLSAFDTKVLNIEIEREIGIGTWYEDGQLRDAKIKTIAVVNSQQFPNAQHHAYRFKGDSMDDIGILDGDVIFCVAYEDTADIPLDGKAVVIERNRAGLIEVSLRIAKVFPDRTEFVTASKTNTYKPVVVDKRGRVKNSDGEKIKIVSVYIGLTRGSSV